MRDTTRGGTAARGTQREVREHLIRQSVGSFAGGPQMNGGLVNLFTGESLKENIPWSPRPGSPGGPPGGQPAPGAAGGRPRGPSLAAKLGTTVSDNAQRVVAKLSPGKGGGKGGGPGAGGARFQRLGSDDNLVEAGVEDSGGVAGEAVPEGEGPNPRMRFMTYMLLFFTQLCMNLDSGSIPASLTALNEDPRMRLTLTEQGALGSCVYAGMILGSILSAPALEKLDSRRLLTGSTLLNCLLNLLFALSPNPALLFFTKFGAGVTKALMAIFIPLWVDCFAPKPKITLWMSIFQGAAPFGIMFGYIFAGLVQAMGIKRMWFSHSYLSWRIPFFMQALLLVPCFVCLSLLQPSWVVLGLSRNKQGAPGDEEAGGKGGDVGPAGECLPPQCVDPPRRFAKQLVQLVQVRVYMFLVAAISALFFVVTGIQFWVTNYLALPPTQGGLGFPLKDVVIAFALVSATAPILGVVFGGVSVDKFGGYRKSDSALTLCMVYAVLAVVTAIVVAFSTSFAALIFFLWLLLFFGGACVPVITGLYVAAVPQELRALGSAFAMVFMLTFGYCLAPVLCGVLAQAISLAWGFRIMLFWSVFAFAFLYGAWREVVPNGGDWRRYLSLPEDRHDGPAHYDGDDPPVAAGRA